MDNLFQTVLLMSLLGSGVILVLLCLKPLLTRMVPPRWQTWLWTLALLVMVLPVYQWIPVPPPAPAPPALPVQQTQAEPPPEILPGEGSPEENTESVRPETPAPKPEAPEDPHLQGLTLVHLGYLWLAGLLVFLAFLLGSYGRFRIHLHNNSTYFPEHSLLDAVRKELGIRRHIPLRVMPGLPSPILVGILSPVVCLPDPNLPEDCLRMILLHELTHYKRKDLLLKWLALLVNAIHWFNPLAWLLTRRLGQACEDACDRDVTRSMTPQERKLYMYTILTLAQP